MRIFSLLFGVLILANSPSLYAQGGPGIEFPVSELKGFDAANIGWHPTFHFGYYSDDVGGAIVEQHEDDANGGFEVDASMVNVNWFSPYDDNTNTGRNKGSYQRNVFYTRSGLHMLRDGWDREILQTDMYLDRCINISGVPINTGEVLVKQELKETNIDWVSQCSCLFPNGAEEVTKVVEKASYNLVDMYARETDYSVELAGIVMKDYSILRNSNVLTPLAFWQTIIEHRYFMTDELDGMDIMAGIEYAPGTRVNPTNCYQGISGFYVIVNNFGTSAGAGLAAGPKRIQATYNAAGGIASLSLDNVPITLPVAVNDPANAQINAILAYIQTKRTIANTWWQTHEDWELSHLGITYDLMPKDIAGFLVPGTGSPNAPGGNAGGNNGGGNNGGGGGGSQDGGNGG